MRALLLLSFVLLLGCSREAEANAGGKAAPGQLERKAEVTPALAQKAEELLKENADAAIGSRIPFSLDGRRYIARIEEHENFAGEPERPPGKHKGVTVYEAP
jgi:hypothetical protein